MAKFCVFLNTLFNKLFYSYIFRLANPSSSSFVPLSCSDPTQIGTTCNISNTPCEVTQPCQNNGMCNNVNTTLLGYICVCPSGFNGTQCQLDYRPCKPNTCWNNGTPYVLFMTNHSNNLYFVFR